MKTIEERFLAKIAVAGEDECWPWCGSCFDKDGYGKFYITSRESVRAHRMALARHLGRPLAHGMWALHTCNNPPCCNPKHLYEGTVIENIKDMDAAGRRVTRYGEQSGTSKLTAARVRKIRRLSERGLTQRAIATEVGVSQPTVNAVLQGTRWAHVRSK